MTIRAHDLRAAVASLPRVRLAHLPTPLEECSRFSECLGGPRIWIKRDDCTGLALGGNKVRQHEYILGEALSRGVDVVIQGAASQSNQSRQLAAAAAHLGIRCILMPRKDALFDDIQGNQLISRLFGAEIVPVEADASISLAKREMAEQLRLEGHRPAILGMGSEDSLTLAAVAYVDGYLEIVEQITALGEQLPTHIYVTSQVSTQAGLQAAARLIGHSVEIHGINPMDERNEAFESRDEIARYCENVATILGFSLKVKPSDIRNSTDWVGENYGLPSTPSVEACSLLARTQGILADPIYSGKGLAGLIGDIRAKRLGADDRVVFIHTGGLPAIFSYADSFLNVPATA